MELKLALATVLHRCRISHDHDGIDIDIGSTVRPSHRVDVTFDVVTIRRHAVPIEKRTYSEPRQIRLVSRRGKVISPDRHREPGSSVALLVECEWLEA